MTVLAYLKPHIFWVVLIAVGLLLGRSWLQERDARMLANAQIAQLKPEIAQLNDSNAQLRKQIATSDATAQKAVMALKASAAKITTPQQAITAIPDVSTLPLRPLALPNGEVSVDPLNLYIELNNCRQNVTALDACQTARQDLEKIMQNNAQQSALQQDEIKALKAKPSFWHRVGTTAKEIGIGIGIGAILGAKL